MKRGTTILSTCALVLAFAVPGWAQERTLPTHTVTISGSIETIDHNKRVMNIKTSDGTFVAVNAPPSVARFNELKVGDHVRATYNNDVGVRLKPPGEADVDTSETVNAKSGMTKAGLDYGTKAIVRRMTANITGIDRDASSISFEGANGWKYSRRVVDPTVFDQVKVGDKVDITWSTDLTVEVER